VSTCASGGWSARSRTPGEQGTTELQLEEELITIARATMAGPAGGGSAARGLEARERHRRVVARACELIQEHYRESLRLEDVARCVGASPAHLTRIFRRQTGMSIHQYQTRLRLAAALDSVLEPGVDLSALAYELGFASHSHLTASFRSAFGCTPSELRREVRGNRRRALGSSRARAITSSSPGSRDRG